MADRHDDPDVVSGMDRVAAPVGDLRVPRAAVPFLVVGAVAIVAGGAVAAVARPTGFEEGSWVAAYLVLVCGVAPIGLGVGQGWFASKAPDRGTVSGQLGAWVLSAAAVVTGTLAAAPMITVVGGVVLLGVLVSFVVTVRGSSSSGLAIWCYRAILAILVVSIPIGLAMAWSRHA